MQARSFFSIPSRHYISMVWSCYVTDGGGLYSRKPSNCIDYFVFILQRWFNTRLLSAMSKMAAGVNYRQIPLAFLDFHSPDSVIINTFD